MMISQDQAEQVVLSSIDHGYAQLSTFSCAKKNMRKIKTNFGPTFQISCINSRLDPMIDEGFFSIFPNNKFLCFLAQSSYIYFNSMSDF